MGGRGSSSATAVGSKPRRTADGEIHLQGVGKMAAVSAKNVRPGDHIMYNGGSTSKVVSVEKVGRESVKITVRSGGKNYTRTRRNYTLLAVDAVNDTKLFMKASGGF